MLFHHNRGVAALGDYQPDTIKHAKDNKILGNICGKSKHRLKNTVVPDFVYFHYTKPSSIQLSKNLL